MVVPMKRKMLLRMSGVEMKDGVDAYFLELLNRIVTEKETAYGKKTKTS